MIRKIQAQFSTPCMFAMLLAVTLCVSPLASSLSWAGNGNGNNGNGNGNGNKEAGDDVSTQGGKPHCQKSAQYLFQACHHQAMANRWESFAQCENTLAKQDRKECFSSIQTFANQAKKNCASERDDRKGVCADVGREPYQGWADTEFISGEAIEGNDYFPLLLSSSTYESTDTTINREVSDSIQEVDGVACKVVIEEERDSVTDELLERVERLYAQDMDNNIWTCGVLRQQYGQPLNVVISTTGSWQGSTQAGIAMRAQPAFGEIERRSYALGIDEDLTEVRDPETVDSEFVCAGECIILRITSPLAPGGYHDEYYENGVGLVHSENQDGEDELNLQP